MDVRDFRFLASFTHVVTEVTDRCKIFMTHSCFLFLLEKHKLLSFIQLDELGFLIAKTTHLTPNWVRVRLSVPWRWLSNICWNNFLSHNAFMTLPIWIWPALVNSCLFDRYFLIYHILKGSCKTLKFFNLNVESGRKEWSLWVMLILMLARLASCPRRLLNIMIAIWLNMVKSWNIIRPKSVFLADPMYHRCGSWFSRIHIVYLFVVIYVNNYGLTTTFHLQSLIFRQCLGVNNLPDIKRTFFIDLVVKQFYISA